MCGFFFFLPSLTAFLINLLVESTAQFTVCCELSSHSRVKTLFKKYRTLAPGCFVFQKERKKAVGGGGGVELGMGVGEGFLTTTVNLT